ncbi:MAG: SDR family oxidoreductase [Proteobacteria bacterium]|nr:SDR family oxidoreductase [Pseudomonadota bacterium]
MAGGTKAPVALISGGSSGIGLEVARLLRQRGFDLHIAARDTARLESARADLLAAPGGRIEVHPLDVADSSACEALVTALLAREGRIDWLVTSAGMVEPGMFLDQPPEVFQRHMQINYFGTLNLVSPVSKAMAAAGTGRIVLISSAAAFTGIVGYAAYCPSKAAVKALGEALYAELGAHGISVSVAFPPDTDTPQLAAEQANKPEVTKQITAGGGVLSAGQVAQAIVEGAGSGRLVVAPGLLMQLFSWVYSLYAPFFLRLQGRILKKTTI